MTWDIDYYKQRYEYKRLVEQYDLHETGTWAVYGEDKNVDMGGNHCPQLIAIMHGPLYRVIEEAVLLPGFWEWGGGGSFRKMDVINV